MEILLEQTEKKHIDTLEFRSELLQRVVHMDLYQTGETNSIDEHSLLLVNDGEELQKMNFSSILESYDNSSLLPLTIIAIHRGEDSENEYGISAEPDYKGRGSTAAWYEQCIISELIPFVKKRLNQPAFKEIAFAGFSQGALSAFDISWNNPDIFSKTGVFSGMFGWCSVAREDKSYDRAVHRLVHNQVRNGLYQKGMKFFFQCGQLGAREDFNKNGVIDSIDDTIDLMRELIRKGYQEGKDIYYLQLADGKADVAAWAKAFPRFLEWGWGSEL